MGPLFGIAPGGACHAEDVAALPVGSYPAVSPLLRSRRSEPPERSVFCGAFHRVPAGFPAVPRPGVTRHRYFLESGLSSPNLAVRGGHPVIRARPVRRSHRAGQSLPAPPAPTRCHNRAHPKAPAPKADAATAAQQAARQDRRCPYSPRPAEAAAGRRLPRPSGSMPRVLAAPTAPSRNAVRDRPCAPARSPSGRSPAQAGSTTAP